MAFNYSHVSGRPLDPEEITLLDQVDNFVINQSLLKLPGITTIGDLHKRVNVEIQSKQEYEEVVTINIQNIKDEIERIKRQLDGPCDPIEREIRCPKSTRLQRLLEELQNENKDTKKHVKRRIKITKLGLYDSKRDTVVLFSDNLSNARVTVSTYVHEMMHAYFKTQHLSSHKVEEPIVEYCMLQFMKQFGSIVPYIYNSSRFHVLDKQGDGVGHYGFGAYLHDYHQNNVGKQCIYWEELYKAVNNTIAQNHLLKYYESRYNPYPYNKEFDLQTLLYRILTKANTGAKRVFSPFTTRGIDPGCSGSPITPAALSNVKWNKVFNPEPLWAYDQTTNTVFLDGEYIYKIIDFSKIGMYGHIENIYLGKDFKVNSEFGGGIEYLLQDFDSAKNIYVSGANQDYTSCDGILYSKDMKKLICCPLSKTQTIIPSGVEVIGNDAFDGCKTLQSVVLPSSLQIIESFAFDDCEQLTSVDIPASVNIIGNNAFIRCKNLQTIIIRNSNVQLRDDPFKDCPGTPHIV